jgi:hypothetical protein
MNAAFGLYPSDHFRMPHPSPPFAKGGISERLQTLGPEWIRFLWARQVSMGTQREW